MARILFSKQGNAVWISHLDLMRVLQRAFRRAGLLLKHSQGYTPHPCLSIVLPLSVGVSSDYEMMEFELADSETLDCDAIPARLNAVLPEGISVKRCYENGRKLKELVWLSAELTLEYDSGLPGDAAEKLRALFASSSLVVEKHAKSGTVPVDIIPMLRSTQVETADAYTIALRATVAAQNPTLNPLLLVSAIEKYLPALTPDFSKCRRLCLYDAQLDVFL